MQVIRIKELKNPSWGRAFQRISDAIHKYAPAWVQWVESEDDADLLFIHIVGESEIPWAQKKKDKVLIQHCYFTGGRTVWHEYWPTAKLTVSFHDLKKYVPFDFNFISIPWGADPEKFKLANNGKRSFKAMTTGEVFETEAIDKAFEAAKATHSTLIHTGRDFGWDKRFYQNHPLLPDNELIEFLNDSEYVIALREIEGFELMAVEGLMCGARPIVYDLDTYHWYKGHAVFIDPTKEVVPQLIEIFKTSPKSVTSEERKIIVEKFGWANIMHTFYNKLEDCL